MRVESETETKACPWCGETILAVAKKCKHCGEFLAGDASSADPSPGPSMYDVIPTVFMGVSIVADVDNLTKQLRKAIRKSEGRAASKALSTTPHAAAYLTASAGLLVSATQFGRVAHELGIENGQVGPAIVDALLTSLCPGHEDAADVYEIAAAILHDFTSGEEQAPPWPSITLLGERCWTGLDGGGPIFAYILLMSTAIGWVSFGKDLATR